MQSTLEHLRTTYVDSYILHGPSSSRGITGHDWSVWRAMESLHDKGQARLLGISNASRDQLQTLHDGARVKPAFIQNRCFATTGWDQDVREYCKATGITYQGFSLLTANPAALRSRAIIRAAERTAGRRPRSSPFAMDVGMIPLTGTRAPLICEKTSPRRVELDPAEVRREREPAVEATGRT
jgi:diketogulonate reductase-like aldo/keto reductase